MCVKRRKENINGTIRLHRSRLLPSSNVPKNHKQESNKDTVRRRQRQLGRCVCTCVCVCIAREEHIHGYVRAWKERGKHRGHRSGRDMCIRCVVVMRAMNMMHIDVMRMRMKMIARVEYMHERGRHEPSAPKEQERIKGNPRKARPNQSPNAHTLHSLACSTAAHRRPLISGRGTRSGRRSAKPSPVRSIS